MQYYIPNFNYTLTYAVKQLRAEGKLAYEYNPFRNYRLSNETYIYDYATKDYVKHEKGSLIDLDTDKLNFSLNNPVNILCQGSYDGSVNLILEDNRNRPRLINSRFTPLENNTYKIVDRRGDNDSNIYDEDTFDLDVSLYKSNLVIPKIDFEGLKYGGNLKVGTYTFYFKYIDSDGNESDFVDESGIVPCYIGNIDDPGTIRGGISDENSYKAIQFTLRQVDIGYTSIATYYTRSSSDITGIKTVKAYKIHKVYPIIGDFCNILITGDEDTEEISIDDLNTEYFVLNSSKAQEICQNRLFKANIQVGNVDYEDLRDISLRIFARTDSRNAKDLIGEIDSTYVVSTPTPEYYNANNVYNYTGYWDREIYRFGIVYITETGELTPVFNVRGYLEEPDMSDDLTDKIYQDNTSKKRHYLGINEETFQIENTETNPQNSKGVIRIKASNYDFPINGVRFYISRNVIKYLRDTLHIRGYFFVRQKRIPTILAQALTLGLHNNVQVPVIPNSTNEYDIETIVNTDGVLTNNLTDRVRSITDTEVLQSGAAICPEYNLNQPYFNNIFTGSDIPVSRSGITVDKIQRSARHYYATYNKGYNSDNYSSMNEVKIVAIGDSMPLVKIGNNKYRGKVGEAEEAYKFRTIEGSDVNEKKNNIVRGIYGPYLGLYGRDMTLQSGSLINIYIPGFSESNMNTYYQQRYQDSSPYYTISKRYNFNDDDVIFNDESPDFETTCYRGDCYLCTYTHRLNRNFQDPEAPNNDEIVDPNTFKDNYKKGDSESNAKINRGDLNAVQLGSWITFKLYCSTNISYRNIDDSYPTEIGLTGSSRSFYPLQAMTPEGSNKIPESFIMNSGFGTTVSERYNFTLPEVPYIKDVFQTRIIYSDVSVTDAFKNGFRVFNKTNYRDYPTIYGGIMKLVEWYGNLVCIFEHGVALIPVNERVVSGDGAGGNVFINTSKILPENPKMLSNTFGSQWADSVLKTPNYIYGIDTVAKKIWRTNGQTFELISDFKVQKFLNDNISLTERELTPVIGIRNVKTHYNANKQDIIFTFYDNLYGFEEKAWSLCYNELLQKWVTFYSWIPSYSENIDNIFFSFDRNVSKQISKLAVSRGESTSADGIVLQDNIFTKDKLFSVLGVVNRPIPDYYKDHEDEIEWDFTIDESDYSGTINFEIKKYNVILAEFKENNPTLSPTELESKVREYLKLNENLSEKELRKLSFLFFNPRNLSTQQEKYDKLKSKEVWQVNVTADMVLRVTGGDWNDFLSGWTGYKETSLNYYKSVVTISSEDVINAKGVYATKVDDKGIIQSKYPDVNLCSDFWKHGQAGIIDTKDTIRPCNWYGKQHPFEFEFVVADKPGVHKIFNNLQIISNKAIPESFHYEIVGENYDWAHDKKNIYVRQEATKKLYQTLGSDILYNRKYENLIKGKYELVQDTITNKNDVEWRPNGLTCPVKSTIFPWYYNRIDTFDDIYDCYQKANSSSSKDYQNLSGTEVVWDEQLNEFRLLIHSKAVDVRTEGRIRGNVEYLNDLWMVVIPSINYMQKNEDWTEKPPIVLNNIPNDIKETDITEETMQRLNN